MITHSQVSEASFEVRLKAKKCHAFERGNEVYVIPFDQTKEARICLFLTEGILCFSADGVSCPANWNRRVCYHVKAARRRKDINAKRRRTLAMRRAA